MRNLQEHNMKNNIHRKLIPKKYSKFFDNNEEDNILITMKSIEPKNPSNEKKTRNKSDIENQEEKNEDLDKQKDIERRLQKLKELEEKRKKDDEKKKEKIIKIKKLVEAITLNKNGLINLGNTCFMNTCLQLLIHCSPFLEKIFFENPTKKRLTNEFCNLCQNQMNNCSSPKNFKNIFSELHSQYKGNQQHDTVEFCRLLLEDISKEMNRITVILPYIKLDDNNKTKMELNLKFDKIFKRREDSLVIDTFYGQIINIFRCKCGFESYSFEKFLDIPLLFKNNNNNQNLNSLIKDFFEEDEIQWGEKCKQCQKKAKQKKVVKITYPPEILILSLQRYDKKGNKKNNSDVAFSENIDLKDFSDKDCCQEFSTKYNLIGIGNHTGSINFGHYFAYININNEWFEFNDKSCFKCDKFITNSSKAYMLVYKRT